MVKSLFLKNENYYTYIEPTYTYDTNTAVPTMTSDTLPYGIAFSSGNFSNDYPAYKVFDGRIVHGGGSWINNGILPCHVGYEFTNPILLYKISVTGRVDTLVSQNAKSFKFQAFDESTFIWVDLITRINEKPWAQGEVREYVIDNNPKLKKYKRYRILITESQSGNYITVTELKMFEMTTNGDARFSMLDNQISLLDKFNNYGITDVSKIENSLLNSFYQDESTNSIKLLTIPDRDDGYLNIKINSELAIIPQIVKSNGDISLVGVKSVDSINLTANGNVKVSISFDSGITEYAYRNDSWLIITDASEGMTASEINSLSSSIIQEIRQNANTLRFNYSLDNNSQVDRITLNVTLEGYEKIADTKDYTLSYDQSQKKIVYNITKSGTYSVNYVDG